MHLNSKNNPEPYKVKTPCVKIQQFVDSADGSATIGDYVVPQSVGKISDWSVESLQSAGVSVDAINEPYIRGDKFTMDAQLTAGANKLQELVSEAEVKEINNLD